MRNEGGGFAASIYMAMLESSIQVTSHKSLVTSYSSLLSNLIRGAFCPLIGNKILACMRN